MNFYLSITVCIFSRNHRTTGRRRAYFRLLGGSFRRRPRACIYTFAYYPRTGSVFSVNPHLFFFTRWVHRHLWRSATTSSGSAPQLVPEYMWVLTRTAPVCERRSGTPWRSIHAAPHGRRVPPPAAPWYTHNLKSFGPVPSVYSINYKRKNKNPAAKNTF